MNLDTLLAQVFPELVANTPTAYIVVDDANLDTFVGFSYQAVGHQSSQGIVLDDVHVDVDMMSGVSNVLQQLWQEGIAVRHNVHQIVLEGQREVLVDEEVYQLLVLLRQSQVLLFNKAKHGTFRQQVE